MQVNTKIQNPTNFFFNESTSTTEDYTDKIGDFTKKLINTDTCALCKQRYNFTNNIPRILIHCGHTFCTDCLRNFHKNGRVRCPMCLKLVKQIDRIERLPVNHTIFMKLAQDYNETCRSVGGEEINAQSALYGWFEEQSNSNKRHDQQQQHQQQQHQKTGGVQIDEETGLELCQEHFDRIKHFLCLTHRQTCCRACQDQYHTSQECQVIELYDLQDMHDFLAKFFAKYQVGPSGQQSQQQDNGAISGESPMYAESSLKNIPSAFPQSDYIDYSKFKDLPEGCVNLPQLGPDQYSIDDDDDDDGEDDDDEEEEDEDFRR